MGQRPLRDDIPINLPESFSDEARVLRNKLLLYRFRTFGKKPIISSLAGKEIEPRLRQIFIPLLSVISDEALRDELRELIRDYNRQNILDRGMDIEAQLLEVIRDLNAEAEPKKLSVKNVTAAFVKRFAADCERHITPKWIGTIIRRKLQLKTVKNEGNFVISPTELPKLERLYERYGIVEVRSEVPDEASTLEVAETTELQDIGDFGDVPEGKEQWLGSESSHQETLA